MTIFFKILLFIFGEGGGRTRGRGTSLCERHMDLLPLERQHPQLGTWPTTQACALTGIELATFQFASLGSIH